MTDSISPLQNIIFAGVTRIENQKAVILTIYYDIDSKESIKSIKQFLESVRITILLAQKKSDYSKIYQIPNGRHIWLMKIDENGIIFLLGTCKIYPMFKGKTVLEEIEKMFIEKTKERGIVKIQQFLKSKESLKDNIFDPECRSEIKNVCLVNDSISDINKEFKDLSFDNLKNSLYTNNKVFQNHQKDMNDKLTKSNSWSPSSSIKARKDISFNTDLSPRGNNLSTLYETPTLYDRILGKSNSPRVHSTGTS
jgi:hypothetical protein